MNIAAIIILYYPGKEVVANILSYSKHFKKLYIYDNTSVDSIIKSELDAIAGVEFFHDGDNRGISERLNSGCKKAIVDGYNWVLTMDQDTLFAKDTIINYLKCFECYKEKDTTAVIGTLYGRVPQSSNAVCQVEDSVDTITSGMLLNLLIWQKLGGFDEALFIDSVDTEYCLRASNSRYRIIRFTNIHILHHIGTEVYRSSIKSLFTIRKKKVVHSAIRCYYIYRNMLYLESKYKENNPEFCSFVRKSVEWHVKVCFFYNRQMLATHRYIKIAKEDFKNGKMGKIDLPKLFK